LGGTAEVHYRFFGKMHGDHAAKAVDLMGYALLSQYRCDPLVQVSRLFRKALEGFWAHFQFPEHGKPGTHGQGIAAQGPRLVDRSLRGQMGHDFPSGRKGPYGKSTADDLSEGHDIGINAQRLLGSAPAQTESSHHLIEDQQYALLGAEFP